MIPLRIDGPAAARRPWATLLLIALHFIAFAGQWGHGALEGAARTLGLVPARLSSPESWRLLTPWEQLGPLFTHAFVHGGVVHLLGNLWCLFVFGAAVEDRLGPRRFVALYALAGLCAAGAQIMAHPESMVPMIGASGAVAGVMGAGLVLRPGSRVVALVPTPVPLTVRPPAFALLGAWALLQLLLASATQGSETGVAWWAHVGGFGLGATWALAERAREALGAPGLLARRAARG
ncbi:MAG: rhomboid family intramembrane serine protease [Myxococcales bacterium]|nr:rhomboid family intramembrane serine protease [Myxococcales bacterium]